MRTELPSSCNVRLSNVVLPAPGEDMRFTARTPACGEGMAVGVGHAVVLREQVLQNFDAHRPRVGVAGVIADVAPVPWSWSSPWSWSTS